MESTKMYERINEYKKEYVHEQYSRIVEHFKEYDKITKKKMLESIYEVYSDYENIIGICTTRELKYLKMVLDKKVSPETLEDKKYEWERKTLMNKFLVQTDFKRIFIPDEIINNVKEAIKNVNWSLTKKIDDLNEIVVSYCEIQGSSILNTVCSFASVVTDMDENFILRHMINNKLFRYYVMIVSRDIESLGRKIPIALCHSCYYIEEELNEERKKQGLAGVIPIDVKVLETLFYNDFDVNNKKIKKFLDELKKLPFFWFTVIGPIKKFAMLNIDRTPLKESFKSVPALNNYNLTEFFKLLDEAMDEMPSGALNGFTPNQAKEMKQETKKIKYKKEKEYKEQQNACLSRTDAKLFYKIYFGLLEFTNKKYKIKKNLKINSKQAINPFEIQEIVEKFWENKDSIVLEFCLNNPYKFTKEELKITSEFKKGFRGIVMIIKFEKEYTAIMTNEKIYMIKGLYDNIDKIVSYQDLPQPVMTSVIPFKNVLVYDGLLAKIGVKMGNNFAREVEEEYQKSIKYYHL